MMLILAACLALAVGDETSVEDLAAATPEEAEAAATPDRSAPPVVIPAEPLQLPVPDVYQLTDAVTVMHVRVPGVRKVELSAWFLRGALDLDGALTHGASGVGELQDVATASMASDELEIYTDLNELSVSSYMDDQDGSVDLSSPRDNLEMAWDVWRDVMLQPSFPKADVKRHVRSETIFLRDEAPNDAGTAASYGSHWAWTPKDHALGYRPNLTELSKLKTDALVERHARWVDSSPIVVFVVGDVAYDDVQPKLAEIFADMGSAGERSDEIALAAPDTRVLAIDTPGNAQVALRLRTTAPPLTHPDRSAAELVNFALGGNFLSRLNRNLREEKGYTYGAGSRYVAGPERAYWQVSTSVAGEFAGAAIQEIEAELDGLCNGGLIDEELAAARSSLISDWNGTLQTAEDARSFYEDLFDDRLNVEAERTRLLGLSKIDIGSTQRVASEHLASDKTRVWVIAGDRSQLEPQLTEMGWSPEWITSEQAILGDF